MGALLLIAFVMAYFVIGGFAYAKIQLVGKERCTYSNGCDAGCGHAWLAGASVILWPVTLPILFGILTGETESRADRKHNKKLVEARRTRELERELGIR